MNSRRHPCACALGFALWLCLSPGSARAIPPAVHVTQLVVDTWTTNDGLPQDRVQAITQTRDGLLWVGTEAGLARFDGHRFVVFSPPAFPQLRNEPVTSLFGSRDGALWVGTQSGGLYRVQASQPTPVPWAGSVKKGAVWHLVEAPDGTLWAATANGLARISGGTIELVEPGTGQLYAIARTAGGDWWAGGPRGLFKWSAGRLKQYTEHDGYRWGRVASLALGPDESLWVASRGSGLARFQHGRWTDYSAPDSTVGNLTRAVAVDRDGETWIGTWNGLARVEGRGFSTWGSGAGRMPTGIDTIFEDRDGALWVGSMGGGLYRLRHGAVATHTVAEGLDRDDLLAVCATRDGHVWVGTGDAGAMVRDGRRWVRAGTDTGLADYALWGCSVGRRNEVWLGAGAGLYRAKDGRVTAMPLPGRDPTALVYSIYASSSGEVWVTLASGVYRLDENGASLGLVAPANEDIEQVLGEDVDQTIWLSGAKGLYRWRDGDLDLAWAISEDSYRPICMVSSPNGTLWFGTFGAGLVRYRAGQVTVFGRSSGLGDLTIAGIADDGRGFYWLATHAGLFRIAKDTLEHATAVTTLSPVVYTVRDGLRSHYTDERGQPTIAVTPDGHLWVSTTRGLAEIDPSRLPTRPEATGVFLDELEVDGRHLPFGETAPPGRGAVRWRFSASAHISSPHVRFRYRLDGFDPDWVDAGTSRVATYTNVPPGHYRFIVNASDESSGWGPDQATALLVLSPHWYQTWWFRGSAAATLLGLIIAIPVLRARRARLDAIELATVVDDRTSALRDSEGRYKALAEELEDRVEERTRALQEEIGERQRAQVELTVAKEAAEAAVRAKTAFLANMSHELRTPLNAVIGYSELLQEMAQEQGLSEFERDLGRIRGAGQHLLALVSDVLDIARIEADRIQLTPTTFVVHDLVKDLIDAVQGLAGRNGNSLHAIEAPGLNVMKADLLRVKQILLNLLGNACKFTVDGDISLDVSPREDAAGSWVIFAVRDSGIGIAPEDLPKLFTEFSQVQSGGGRREGAGLGLAISQRLASAMGGSITVRSAVGKGTTFTVQLPAAPPRTAAETASGRSRPSGGGEPGGLSLDDSDQPAGSSSPRS